MLRVGLTGGIGSGKTTVARVFQVLGVPVYDADKASKKLMNEDAQMKMDLISAFGEETYKEGVLDRKYLAETVFNDPEKLVLLNSIVHPATLHHASEWMKKQEAPYIIKEAALIFESGSNKDLDYVIGVYSPLELRISRTMARDSISREQVFSRIQNQMNEESKMALCDFIIQNDPDHSIVEQVLELHHQLLELANN